MKQTTDSRIENGKNVTKDELIDCIKASDPVRFDQMLIETDKRKTLFYVKYNASSYVRRAKTLSFPLFKDLIQDFNRNIKSSGEPTTLTDENFIKKIISKGNSPKDTPKYNGKDLIFSELTLVVEGNIPKSKQPIYYIPSETIRQTCGTCDGDKYTTCTETKCKGEHIYKCGTCKASGELNCKDCNARGEYSCPSCHGRGELKCSACSGSGKDRNSDSVFAKCKSCNGSGERKCSSVDTSGNIVGLGLGNLTSAAVKKGFGNEYCGGSGVIKCKTCKSSGKITCDTCKGEGEIECATCYGDRIDNRYGKVDCKTCETAGELASISYIETDVKFNKLELIVTDGENITAPDFDVNTLNKYTENNTKLDETYVNLNGEIKDKYDKYSTLCSAEALSKIGVSKDKYPKLIREEMYYEGVPCATLQYNHILSASYHDVSVLSIDKEKDVIFHSNPTSVIEKESLKQSVSELIAKAFSTKKYKDKIDRKHEAILMVHMAKADGIIEEEEKRYLSQSISGLVGFTNKEKNDLFALMSNETLSPILPESAYFSSRERAAEAQRKITALLAKTGNNHKPAEIAKLEEINNAIELGYKAKPSVLGQFLKTWQVSGSIFLIVVTLVFVAYYAAFIAPSMKPELAATLNTPKSDDKSDVEQLVSTTVEKPIIDEKNTIGEEVSEEVACTVNGTKINCRVDADPNSKVLFQLNPGDYFYYLKNTADKKDVIGGKSGYWKKIDFNGKRGWIFSTFITCD